MPEINYWAILVAALSSMVIGSLWYGPLFGKIWMEGMGWPVNDKAAMDKMMADGKKQMPLLYGTQFILSLIMAFCLAHILWRNGMEYREEFPVSLGQGIVAGAFLWLGFIMPVQYGTSLWSGKKFKYVAVELGYWLVLLMVMGGVLSVWR